MKLIDFGNGKKDGQVFFAFFFIVILFFVGWGWYAAVGRVGSLLPQNENASRVISDVGNDNQMNWVEPLSGVATSGVGASSSSDAFFANNNITQKLADDFTSKFVSVIDPKLGTSSDVIAKELSMAQINPSDLSAVLANANIQFATSLSPGEISIIKNPSRNEISSYANTYDRVINTVGGVIQDQNAFQAALSNVIVGGNADDLSKFKSTIDNGARDLAAAPVPDSAVRLHTDTVLAIKNFSFLLKSLILSKDDPLKMYAILNDGFDRVAQHWSVVMQEKDAWFNSVNINNR